MRDGRSESELQEPVDGELRDGGDNDEVEEDRDPCPGRESFERAHGGVAREEEAVGAGFRDGDPPERDHGRPDDHAPGAEGAERVEALVLQPGDEDDASEEAEAVEPPEPLGEVCSGEDRGPDEDRRGEGGDADDGVGEPEEGTLPGVHVRPAGDELRDVAVGRVGGFLQGLDVLGEQFEGGEPADDAGHDREPGEADASSA